jgi:hypothetical protein
MASERPEKTPAWLVMWGCLCSDVRVEKADLPKVCPGHGREAVDKPERLDALTQYVGVHECPTGEQARCPQPSKAVA